MTDPSTATPVVAERADTRTDGPMTGEERAVLDHWLAVPRHRSAEARGPGRRAARPSRGPTILDEPHRDRPASHRTVTSTTSTPRRRQLTWPRIRPRWSPPAPTPRRVPTSPYLSGGCAKASRSIYVGSSPTSSRSTPATSATWIFSARRSTAVPATDHDHIAQPTSPLPSEQSLTQAVGGIADAARTAGAARRGTRFLCSWPSPGTPRTRGGAPRRSLRMRFVTRCHAEENRAHRNVPGCCEHQGRQAATRVEDGCG